MEIKTCEQYVLTELSTQVEKNLTLEQTIKHQHDLITVKDHLIEGLTKENAELKRIIKEGLGIEV